MVKKLANSIELPEGLYKATKIESNHNNIPKVCRGYLADNIIEIGKSLSLQSTLQGKHFRSGLWTTEIKEIEVIPDGIIIRTQNSTYKLEEDASNIYGNGDE